PAGIKGFGHGARLRDPAMARYVRSRFRSSPRTGPRSPIHNYCQYLLGTAVRTVPPCVQGECYPRISPYPLELLPDAYRAVHHGERALARSRTRKFITGVSRTPAAGVT